jgi:aminopeptidase N
MNRKVKFCIFSLSFFCLFSLNAQLLSSKKSFTRIDSLRGFLSPARTSIDITFYDLDVVFDTVQKTISGQNSIYFKTTSSTQIVQLDLDEKLSITSVKYKKKDVIYSREYNTIYIDLPALLDSGKTGKIDIAYSGKPQIAKRAPWDGGFVWSRNKEGDLWLAVACEGLGASSWWPCEDHLSDEPDSMQIKLTVPKGLTAVSNGNLRKEESVSDKMDRFTWFVSYPVNTYNVTFNIGKYVHWSDTLTYADGEKLPLDYYVMPYNLERSKVHFEQVKPMLLCYEKYLGKYPFPNDGYALVETPYLGMEHQGAIAYGNKYKTGYDGKDFSGIGLDFDYIIIHETGHEWWGNSVSAKDIGDMWIHESFCTYSEAIYVECMFGKEKALAYINSKKKSVQNQHPIQGPYSVNEEGSGDMYNKGMLMLNTLRTLVNNDKLWWQTIKSISDTTFKLKTTDAASIIAFFEQRTKLKLDKFFEQYLGQAEIPKLSFVLRKKGKERYSFEYVWQTDVKGFHMPILYYIGDKLYRREATTTIKKKRITIKNLTDFKIADNLIYVNSVRVL